MIKLKKYAESLIEKNIIDKSEVEWILKDKNRNV